MSKRLIGEGLTPSVSGRILRRSRRQLAALDATAGGLISDSQAYAVRAIRAAFAWLTTVQYLVGNPWNGVTDPATMVREVEVQVERALSADLWTQLRAELDARCYGEDLGGLTPTEEEARQWRIARAAILLMGDSGLGRDEAANAASPLIAPVVINGTEASLAKPVIPYAKARSPTMHTRNYSRPRLTRSASLSERGTLPGNATCIYVRDERQRTLEAAAQYYADIEGPSVDSNAGAGRSRRHTGAASHQRGMSGAVSSGPDRYIGRLSLKLENTNMNKQELIDEVANEVGIAKSAAAETIDAFLATVTNAVVNGEAVQLIGFGSFSTGARAARTGRNPKTGEALQIAASTTVKFTVGKAFKDAVNK